MNGNAIKPLYLIRSGPGFVFLLSTLDTTTDPVDAIALPLEEALKCARRLRERGFAADVVLAGQAIRAHRAMNAAFWATVLLLALAAMFFCARAAFADYRFTISHPALVCVVPNGGIAIDLTHMSASIAGICHPADWIFSSDFEVQP
jgi:hypothetical protein